MSGHTPGPWDAEYGTDGYYFITHSDGLELRDNTTANARLISAAPDLLEALEGLIDLHSVIPDDRLARIAADALLPGDGRSGPSRHEATLLIAARGDLAKARPTPEAPDHG